MGEYIAWMRIGKCQMLSVKHTDYGAHNSASKIAGTVYSEMESI